MHVAQYERHGSIPAFLQQYLNEVNQYGYPANPMEQEAVAFAESVFPSRGKSESAKEGGQGTPAGSKP